jgi:hypothetical protein
MGKNILIDKIKTKIMKTFFTFLFITIASSLYSQCDTLNMAKEETYSVRAIEEAVDYIGLTPRKLTCDELIYINQFRSNIVVVMKLDDYTEVTIYPKYINNVKR